MRRITVVTRATAGEAVAGPLVSDTFNRADSSTSLGTADTGQTWTALAGTWGIDTNRAYSPGTTPPGRDVAAEAGAANVKVAADLVARDTGGGPGLLFRAVDANNYWLFVAEAGAGRWALYKRVAGSFTLVGSLSETLTTGRLEVGCSGSTITCKVDGVTKITATDVAHETATRHGLRDYKDGAVNISRFDNFLVEAA